MLSHVQSCRSLTALGRIVKTIYILRYIYAEDLRRRVQLQLNRGESSHTLARWWFFANRGEFRAGDYEEIMNKVSYLRLLSNDPQWHITLHQCSIGSAHCLQYATVTFRTIAAGRPGAFPGDSPPISVLMRVVLALPCGCRAAACVPLQGVKEEASVPSEMMFGRPAREKIASCPQRSWHASPIVS